MLWQACNEWGSREGPAEQNADTSASAQSPAPIKKYLWIACRVAGSCSASKHLHCSSHITISHGVVFSACATWAALLGLQNIAYRETIPHVGYTFEALYEDSCSFTDSGKMPFPTHSHAAPTQGKEADQSHTLPR